MKSRFEGVWRVVRFNWTRYVITVVLVIGGNVALFFMDAPSWLGWTAGIGIGIASFWTIASLGASYYIYDYSPLYSFNWLDSCLSESPRQWVSLHLGLDEVAEAARRRYPNAAGMSLDIYNPELMSGASARRARSDANPISKAGNACDLPLGSATVDAVFVIFSAHELRDPTTRRQLLAEGRRLLTPRHGRLILVEHFRDAWNFAAFGPGCMHFLSRQVWLDDAASAGLRLAREDRVTPLVGVLAFESLGWQGSLVGLVETS